MSEISCSSSVLVALLLLAQMRTLSAGFLNISAVLNSVFGLTDVLEIDYGQPLLRPSYDYVIVGAGPAGCVLANRLSEDPSKSVLLIEIGRGEIPMFSDPPLLGPTLASTSYNFGYQTEVQKHGCQGLRGKRCSWAHGRGVGGSSIINNVIYTRGNKRDYDSWARAGNPGWSWDEMLPYFKKVERANIRDFGDNGFHGKSGRLSVEDCPFRSKIATAFVKSAQEVGYPYLDYNAGDLIGVSFLQAHTLRGHRATGGNAYLKDIVHRPNLHIMTRSWATKVHLDPKTKEATGIDFVHARRTYSVQATREVILSAGAFESAKLLMLSGVGPAEHLKQHGIKVNQDLPVGEQVTEHGGVFGPVFVLQNDPDGLRSLEPLITISEFMRFKGGSGPLTSNSVESLMYVKSPVAEDPDPGLPDVEIMQAFVSFGFDSSPSSKFAYQLSDEVDEDYFRPLGNVRAFMYLPMLLKARARGQVRLKSTNPFHHPQFKYQYFEDERDVEALVYGILQAINVTSRPAFQKLGVELYANKVPGCKHLKFNTLDYWRCHVRTLTATFQHQVATCKMGPASDPEAVVDHRLRVHGIKRLRVADVGIIPDSPTGHTSAHSFVIGEKAADLIKEDN
ncbi:glucose dehydrogenase [FAD, quinone]-like [Toxorhynchites rutilus septentrionalis]|uniref:glucose dehydrogenase [FAD, quinone]-like n=1 Tax=Toxorhynchites rutilus septentrionalis TaxID=329112 RepID=UPI002479BC72|nr:glucose dehydrogenase [FAD, quinone]-like [Toxorhynchites rutilus septentrionalis]XP_055629905.1 glucose dehydrogenase [FAD, quinone]-like [Toxorhynchites rutilus septentrionalis]